MQSSDNLTCYALEAKDICLSYQQNKQQLTLFKCLNLRIAKGEIVALVGKSGCGKTTLLQLLACVTKADSGKIYVQGKEKLLPGHAYVVPQQPSLLPWLTLLDNLLLPQKLHQKLPKFSKVRPSSLPVEHQQILERMLVDFGLHDAKHLYPHQLSGGMQQRGALLRASFYCAIHGGVLLLDEPLGALDAITKIHMQHWLAQQLWNNTTSGLLVTHDITEALLLGDIVIVMQGLPAKLKIFAPKIQRKDRFFLRQKPTLLRWEARLLQALEEKYR